MCVSVPESLSLSSTCFLISLCHAQTHTLSLVSLLSSLSSLSLSLSLSPLPPSHTHSLTHIFLLPLPLSVSLALNSLTLVLSFFSIARDGDNVKLCYSSKKKPPSCAEFTVRTMLVPLI